MLTVGQKVAALRATRKWTLQELSNRSGVSISHLSALENGTRANPSILMMSHIAKAFGVSLDYFAMNDEVAEKVIVENEAELNELLRTAVKLGELYDTKTRSFLVSERSIPYVSFALQLAQLTSSTQAAPADTLRLVAQFMSEQKPKYRPHKSQQ